LSHLGGALDQFASHPEAQSRLQLCPHVPGVLCVGAQRVSLQNTSASKRVPRVSSCHTASSSARASSSGGVAAISAPAS
jgi:hypothetical protein